jgi:hypothetical protein
MNVVRSVTAGAGIVDRTPPEALADRATVGRASRISVQAVHFAFGAAFGAAYVLVPAGIRRLPFAGPAFGLAVWAGFETLVAPPLGKPHARRRPALARLAIAADHALYGAILGR